MNIGDIVVYREMEYLGEFDGYGVKSHEVVVLQVFHDTFGLERALVYGHPGKLEVLDTSKLEAIEDD